MSKERQGSRPAGLVSTLLERFLESVFADAATLDPGPSDGAPIELTSVTEYWRPRIQNGKEGRVVAIEGSLSLLAPALPGNPRAKRDLHRDTRRSLAQIETDLLGSGMTVKPTTLDSLLSYTAGQMVIRPMENQLEYVYLGLYHSIVRNSIPVFVEREYFYDRVYRSFDIDANDLVCEARVVGRLFRPQGGAFFLDFLKELGVHKRFSPKTLEQLAPKLAIQVDGGGVTGITKLGPSRYLDGDIWVAVYADGTERVVGRFLDLADPRDLRREREALRHDTTQAFPGGAIISEYDQVETIFHGSHLLNPQALVEHFYEVEAGKAPLKKAVGEGDDADVFLSHNSVDKGTLGRIVRGLESRDISVWFDETSIIPGRPWQEAIEDGIERAHSVAVALGPGGFGKWQIPEMRLAVRLAVEQGRPVVPILLPHVPEDVELPPFLRAYKWVDARDGLTPDVFDDLEWAIKGEHPSARGE